MNRRIKPTILIAIAAVALLFSAVYAIPDSAKAVELLVITNTPTPSPDTPTPTPTNTPTETPPVEPPTDTPTPTLTATATATGTLSINTPTPTNPPVQPPQETEVVLLPQTGEYPIDPQLGIQLFIAFVFLAVIGIVLFRAIRGSRTQE